jgi:multidrug resistance efflux pump
MGVQVHSGDVLSQIQVPAPLGQPHRDIKASGDGTIALDNGIDGSWYTAGQQLATAYDLNKIYVTGRVDKVDIAGVHVGERVDIDV